MKIAIAPAASTLLAELAAVCAGCSKKEVIKECNHQLVKGVHGTHDMGISEQGEVIIVIGFTSGASSIS